MIFIGGVIDVSTFTCFDTSVITVEVFEQDIESKDSASTGKINFIEYSNFRVSYCVNSTSTHTKRWSDDVCLFLINL